MNEKGYNFDVIFQKMSELKKDKEVAISLQEMQENEEINELRELVLDISEKEEQYYSTT